MNFKKHICIVTVFGMLFFMVSCAAESKEGNLGGKQNSEISKIDNSSIEAMLRSTPKNINRKISDDLSIEADVKAPIVNKADVVFANNVRNDDQKIVNAFFKGKAPKKEIRDDDNSASYNQGNNYLLIDDGYWSFHAGNHAYLKAGTTDALSTKNDIINQLPPLSGVYQKENLEFMPKNQAIGEIIKVLQGLSINVNDDVEIYAIDSESYKKQQEIVFQEELNIGKSFGLSEDEIKASSDYQRKEFTKDNEFYIMYFTALQNDIPVTQKGYTDLSSGNERMMQGTTIEVWFSKNGIMQMYVNANYSLQGVAESPTKLITVEDAINIVQKKQDVIIATGKTKIVEIDFEYAPVAYSSNRLEVKLVPTWSFHMTDTYSKDENGKQSTMNGHRMVLINAITGEEIK